MRGAGDLDRAWVNRTKRCQERVSAGTPCGGSLTLGPNICLPWGSLLNSQTLPWEKEGPRPDQG